MFEKKNSFQLKVRW